MRKVLKLCYRWDTRRLSKVKGLAGHLTSRFWAGEAHVLSWRLPNRLPPSQSPGDWQLLFLIFLFSDQMLFQENLLRPPLGPQKQTGIAEEFQGQQRGNPPPPEGHILRLKLRLMWLVDFNKEGGVSFHSVNTTSPAARTPCQGRACRFQTSVSIFILPLSSGVSSSYYRSLIFIRTYIYWLLLFTLRPLSWKRWKFKSI